MAVERQPWSGARERARHRGDVRAGLIAKGFAEASATAIVTADSAGLLTFWNPAAERLFGHREDEVLGRSLTMIMPERFRSMHEAGVKRMSEGGETRLAGRMVELVALTKDGVEVPIEVTISSWLGPEGDRLFGAQIHDISERREHEARLLHLAHHDPLTGLPNRVELDARLDRSIADHGSAAVLLLELDGFKAVNDMLGHTVGDALLETVAIRMQSAVHPSSMLARMGGDGFALLVPGERDVLAARALAEELIGAFKAPFQLAGHELHVGARIGMALAPLHASSGEELIVRADLALLEAKRLGGTRVVLFERRMANAQAAHRAFKDELLKATVDGEWQLFYQPQVRLADGVLIGAEALLRWRHPKRGLVVPATFMPVLERHLVSLEVGRWVLDEACRQLAAWRAAGSRVPRVSVNLFESQFRSGTLEADVRAAVGKHGLEFGDVELEVTERIALGSDRNELESLRAICELGTAIAFDDFGTGFASLVTLKHFPVTRLKIDRSFVVDIAEEAYSAAIVAAVVSLGGSLGIDVIAEGVETEGQRLKLVGLGCGEGQGYLFGRPVPASAFPAKVRLAA